MSNYLFKLLPCSMELSCEGGGQGLAPICDSGVLPWMAAGDGGQTGDRGAVGCWTATIAGC